MPKIDFVSSLRHVLKQLEPLHGTLLLPSESDGERALDFDDIKQRLSAIHLHIQQDKNTQPNIKRVKEEGNQGGAEISRFFVIILRIFKRFLGQLASGPTPVASTTP